MHLSLPFKTDSTHRSSSAANPTRRTATWLLAFVLIFFACASLGACSFSPKPVEVGAVVQPNKVKPGPLPKVVAETEPRPAGYFQTRRLERETSMLKPTTTLSTPTASTSPMPPVGPTR